MMVRGSTGRNWRYKGTGQHVEALRVERYGATIE